MDPNVTPIHPADALEASALRERAGRVPPHAEDVERSVLGAVLIESSVLPAVASRLRPGDFYDQRHQEVFAALVALSERSEPVDLITLSAELKAREAHDRVGGYYLTELTRGVASAANAEHHALIVREKAMLRDVIRLGTRAVGEAWAPGADPFDVLDSLREAHDGVLAALPSEGYVSMGAALDAADARVDVPGAPCRLAGLAKVLGGWKPGKFYVGAGRPGMGKSSHAKSEARSVAGTPPEAGGGSALVFTLEMGADEYADRVRDEEEGFSYLPGAVYRNPRELPVFLDDSARLTTGDIRAKVHRFRSEAASRGLPPLALVVVDYLQLLQGRGDTREQEVASIARDLKLIAREQDVPVLALAQLSRACEQRTNKRPMLSDLRESGEIEQAADVVLFYYRDEMYGARDTEGPDGILYPAAGLAEIIVGKQRGGATGTVWARFDGPTTSFRDFDDARPGLPARLTTATPF